MTGVICSSDNIIVEIFIVLLIYKDTSENIQKKMMYIHNSVNEAEALTQMDFSPTQRYINKMDYYNNPSLSYYKLI